MPLKYEGANMSVRIELREEYCIGCELCRVFCQQEHSMSGDILKAFSNEVQRPLPRIRLERSGETCLAVQCQQCSEPWCVYACLSGAMQRDPVSGIVSVDEERCFGCWTCILLCPYGVLTRDETNKVVVKCDVCSDREIPACVANCPNEALVLNRVEVEARSQ